MKRGVTIVYTAIKLQCANDFLFMSYHAVNAKAPHCWSPPHNTYVLSFPLHRPDFFPEIILNTINEIFKYLNNLINSITIKKVASLMSSATVGKRNLYLFVYPFYKLRLVSFLFHFLPASRTHAHTQTSTENRTIVSS